MNSHPNVSRSCSEEPGGFFSRRPLLLRLTLTILFLAALGIRIYRIADVPLDFNQVREYLHALRVRSYYYAHFDSSAPEWMMQVAASQAQMSDVMEPPDIEGMTLLLYWLTGGVHLWIPRLLSSVFWIVGGGVLYRLAKKTTSTDAAVVSTAFYLLLPYGVFASRSFMRDPLLVMTLLCSIFTIARYHEEPTMRRMVIAGIVAALAIFVKPMGVFVVFGAFMALAIQRQGVRKSMLDPQSWVFVAVAIPIAAVFHGYPLLSMGQTGEVGMFIKPQYVLDPASYRYWLANIQGVIGFGALVVALLGLLMSRQGAARALAAGLWCGYVVFGLVFIYYARTHPYYHLQLIPVVAISLGPVGALVLERLDRIATRWHIRAAVWGVLGFTVVLALGVTGLQLAPQDSDHEIRIYEDVGEAVHHSTNTVYLTEHYGYALEYYGWLHGKNWPCVLYERTYGRTRVSGLSAEERFLANHADDSPEYFIITNIQEFEEQADLRRFLTENFPMTAQDEDYLIFDLTSSIRSGEEIPQGYNAPPYTE